MYRLKMTGAALAGLLLWTTPLLAQVSIRVPFVGVDVGPGGNGVHVRAPFVRVNVPPKYPVYFQPTSYAQSGPIVSQTVPPLPVPQQQGTPVPIVPQQPGTLEPAVPQQSGTPIPVVPQEQIPFQPQPGNMSVPALPGDMSVPALPGEQVIPGQPGTQILPSQPGVPILPSQPGPAVVPAGPSTVILPGPISVHDFVRTFVPGPGRYEVDMIHPRSGQPVHVCFELPPGHARMNLRRCLGCYYIEFDYGHCEVEIHFRLFGRVTVDYDD